MESAKRAYALEAGKTNGRHWESDEQALADLVQYFKAYPLCPCSTTDEQNAKEAAADYDVNPIGSNAACATVPTHRLP